MLPLHAGHRPAPWPRSAIREKRPARVTRTVGPMITNVSLVTVWVTDQDEAKAFYTDVLGFEEATDVTMGDGYRWLTVRHPDHPELELTLSRPGPPLDEEDAAA